MQELGKEPQPEEIAKEMNLPVEKVRGHYENFTGTCVFRNSYGEEEDSHLEILFLMMMFLRQDAAAFTLLKEQLIDV